LGGRIAKLVEKNVALGERSVAQGGRSVGLAEKTVDVIKTGSGKTRRELRSL
jgi:hypothetical protein